MIRRRRAIGVSGPKAREDLSGIGGHERDRLRLGPALRREYSIDGFRIERIGGEPVQACR